MRFIKRCLYLPVCLGIIILCFTVASLLDIVIAALAPRFYSSAAFIVSFGVGGIFASLFCYSAAVNMAVVKNEFARWSVIIFIWITALVFIFLLSALEAGEYESAFIAFGITLALTTLLFLKGKIDL